MAIYSKIYTEKDKIKLHLQIRPQAKRNQVIGIIDSKIRVAIAAPPVDGKANLELIKFIAKTLQLRQCDINIMHGEHSSIKVLEIHLSAKSILDKLIISLT